MDSHCPELFQQFSVVHVVEEPFDYHQLVVIKVITS